jgi:hypothetical protein
MAGRGKAPREDQPGGDQEGARPAGIGRATDPASYPMIHQPRRTKPAPRRIRTPGRDARARRTAWARAAARSASAIFCLTIRSSSCSWIHMRVPLSTVSIY